MSKTTKAQPNNFGPAATTMKTNDKEIEVGFGIIMTGEDVKEFELNITKPEKHTCVIDGDKAYRIGANGEIIRGKVEIEKFDKIAKQRKAQGRPVQEKRSSQDNEIGG